MTLIQGRYGSATQRYPLCLTLASWLTPVTAHVTMPLCNPACVGIVNDFVCPVQSQRTQRTVAGCAVCACSFLIPDLIKNLEEILHE